jgi:restriction endonuclease Mrr
MIKKISPLALNALKEALVNIYWYKADLISFISSILSDSSVISRIDQNLYKRNIVVSIVDFLSKNEEIYQNDLLKLMTETIKIDNFNHLKMLEDGDEKVKKAKLSVDALKSFVIKYSEVIEDQKGAEEKRKKAYEESLKNKGIREKLEEIKNTYFNLVVENNFQKRGFLLEKVVKDLFELFDLDPKASFRNTGEQIDGAFTFDSTDYLFEAKWQKDLVNAADLDAFAGKLSRKLDNTLGLFLSIGGYSEDAVKIHSSGRGMMILMDGNDLMAVLEGRIDFVQLLLRKRRCAAQTGNIYLKIHEIL